MPDDFADTVSDSTRPFGSAVPTVAPGDVNGGSIEEAGDLDLFKVTLQAGQSYVFDAEGLATDVGTLSDPVVMLRDSSGALVTSAFGGTGVDDDSGVGSNAQLIFTPTESGTFFIEVGEFGGNDTGSYRLSALATPAITSNGGEATATISLAENNSAVTTVTAQLSASPGDISAGGDQHTAATGVTFSVAGGADAGDFTINSTTGALSFTSAPNFEAPADSDGNNSYVVEVRATDNGNPVLIDTQTITVNVGAVAGVTVEGTSGIDVISPTETVAGEPFPGTENDTIFGFDGADDIDGGAGADHMEGGNGKDTYHVDNAGDVIVESATGGADFIISSISLSISNNANVENIELAGSANLAAKGNEGENLLEGNNGNNHIYALGGDDVMSGAAGADTFAFADDDGDDVIDDFEPGTDTIDFTRSDDVDSFDDLDITLETGGVEVDYGTGTIFVDDLTSVAQLDAEDFAFA